MSIKIKLHLLILIIVVTSESHCFISDTLIGWKASIGGGIGLNNHSASFKTLNPCQTCAGFDNFEFTNSEGNGFFISTLMSARPSKMLRVELGLDYFSTNVEFKNRKFLTNAVTSDGRLDKLYINYSMKPSLDYLNIMLGPTIVVLNNVNIGFHLNVSSFINSSVEYTERLDAPDRYSYYDGTKEYASQKNLNLTDMSSIVLGFTPSISYDFYIGKIYAITPKVSYTLGFSNLQKDINWKMSGINLSLNVTLTLSDLIINNGEPLPECPPGMKRDNFMNCVPIECPEGMILNQFGECDCPEGFKKIGQECEKIDKKDIVVINKECGPDQYYSEVTKKCEPLFPIMDKNCKGAYLAIQTNIQEHAEEIQLFFQQKGYTNFVIEQSNDVIDHRKIVYKVRTSCYPSSSDAYIARKELSKFLEGFQNEFLKGTSVEIIFNN